MDKIKYSSLRVTFIGNPENVINDSVIALIYVVTHLAHNSSPKAAVHKLVMQQKM